MRKFWRLALFALLALSTFLGGVFIGRITPTLSHQERSAWQVLLSFENQDLDSVRTVLLLVRESDPHDLLPDRLCIPPA